MPVEVSCPYFEVLCRLALAQILADCGDGRKCLSHLQQLRAIARAIDNKHLEFSCLIGFAQIALEHGRQRPGLNALGRGLELGREYGYAHQGAGSIHPLSGWVTRIIRPSICVHCPPLGAWPRY